VTKETIPFLQEEMRGGVQGLGIGSALVDAVTTVAADRGVDRVRAVLSPDNEPSRRLVTRIAVRLQVVDGLLAGEGRLHLLRPARVDRQAVLALDRFRERAA
jgi:hypothetical protein